MELKPQIQWVWDQNMSVYGARKTWKQLNNEHIRVTKCSVQRLMRNMGLCGVVRGKAFETTPR